VTLPAPPDKKTEHEPTAPPECRTSWQNIVPFYKSLEEAGLPSGGMVKLTEKIASSPYQKLHAWTSMHDLCLTQTPRSPVKFGPYLRISPLFDGHILFRYIDTYIESRQWTRTVEEDAAFSRLEHFLHQLKWFAHRKPDLAS
jgi:hypothetical protein